MVIRVHEWVPSKLGHGKYMCKHCMMTNLEAEALGLTDHCESAPAAKLVFVTREGGVHYYYDTEDEAVIDNNARQEDIQVFLLGPEVTETYWKGGK